MDITTLGGVKISRSKPKITVRITNNRDDLSGAYLYIGRVGEKFEYAEYTPTKIGLDYLEFTFDELTFSKNYGRFLARLVIAGEERSRFYLHYSNDVDIQVQNA